MPLANVLVPAYPDVPHAPGVPPVLRRVGAIENNVVLLAADAKSLISTLFGGPQWGIFTALGGAVLAGETVYGVDYRREWRVADYPLEGGAFASYDKVAEPFDVRVTFAVTGAQSLISSLLSGGFIGSLLSGSSPGVANRNTFLQALETAGASFKFYRVVTPEFTYDNCTIVHFDYRREAREGATLLKIDVWLRQIRQVASADFTKPPADAATPTAPGGASGSSSVAEPQSVSAADPVSNGTVQPSQMTTTQANAMPPAAPGQPTGASVEGNTTSANGDTQANVAVGGGTPIDAKHTSGALFDSSGNYMGMHIANLPDPVGSHVIP